MWGQHTVHRMDDSPQEATGLHQRIGGQPQTGSQRDIPKYATLASGLSS